MIVQDEVVVGALRLNCVRTSEPSAPDAPVIVLVPGLGLSTRSMLPLLNTLTPHDVIVVDLPGVGSSEDPRQTPTLPGLADVLADFTAAVGVEKAVFLGNSLGAQVAAELANRHPDRVVAAVLVGPTPDPSISSSLRQALRLLRDIPHERLSLIPLAAVSYLRAGPWQMWRLLRRSMQRAEQAMPTIKMPVLIVRGENDPVVQQPGVEELNRLIPGSRLVVIPGAGHAPNYSNPDQLAEVLRQFLLRLDSTDADGRQDSAG